MKTEIKTEEWDRLGALSLLEPGDTVHTISRHVSRSGMTRVISCVLAGKDGDLSDISFSMQKLSKSMFRVDPKLGGVRVTGCGMDMGFWLVYNLGVVLFPQGFGCIGEDCPANDHFNGDTDYEPHTEEHPHWHNDGGYALRHQWL